MSWKWSHQEEAQKSDEVYCRSWSDFELFMSLCQWQMIIWLPNMSLTCFNHLFAPVLKEKFNTKNIFYMHVRGKYHFKCSDILDNFISEVFQSFVPSLTSG